MCLDPLKFGFEIWFLCSDSDQDFDTTWNRRMLSHNGNATTGLAEARNNQVRRHLLGRMVHH